MKLPKSAEVARVSEEIKKREEEQSVFEGLFGKRIIWAEKLNIISNELPSGIWLKRLIVTEELFSLQGVAVSLRAEEMDLIGSFLGNLKTEQGFYADFSDLAVKSIQRRSIKVVEVVDFTIAGLFKQ